MSDLIIRENTELSMNNQNNVVTDMAKNLEIAQMLSKSTIIPVAYQSRPENCYIAIDIASRMNVSPMVVMQNLYVIQGKPSWSGSACNALIRNCGRFHSIELEYVGERNKPSWGAYLKAKRVSDNKEVIGATVTMEIAQKEGWLSKSGNKWATMPEIMLAYRASAWFARVHAPEVMMGLQTSDEIYDTEAPPMEVVNPFDGKE